MPVSVFYDETMTVVPNAGGIENADHIVAKFTKN